MITAPPTPRCEAVTGWRRLDGGQQEPARCHQRRGLRAFAYRATPNSVGVVAYYCCAPGHRERVIGQARRGYRP